MYVVNTNSRSSRIPHLIDTFVGFRVNLLILSLQASITKFPKHALLWIHCTACRPSRKCRILCAAKLFVYDACSLMQLSRVINQFLVKFNPIHAFSQFNSKKGKLHYGRATIFAGAASSPNAMLIVCPPLLRIISPHFNSNFLFHFLTCKWY